MFLSTIVPSTRLNINCADGASPYNFSVPYNFVRGRNLVISIHPMEVGIQSASCYNSLRLRQSATVSTPYQQHINIPAGVTQHSIAMTIYSVRMAGNTTYYLIYTVTVTFDLQNNIITFTPNAVTGHTTQEVGDLTYGVPMLINISTIL